ncbi:hypothetical protein AN958_09724 [Leucoagaricus sp. SymC.cos]|nr:hypothetical protein AN958_09724 [Leucoagaricus sp. SymC.cos]
MRGIQKCSHCGHTPNTEYTIPNDIPSLQAEIQRLDTFIHELNAQRALVLRKLNQLSSTTGALPPELLSTIFTHAYPPPSLSPRINLQTLEADDPVSGGPRLSIAAATAILPDPPAREELIAKPLTLGAVCNHWRQVARETPALWSAIDLRPMPSRLSSAVAAERLGLYSQNAGSGGLNVQIVFHWSAALGMIDEAFERAVQPLTEVLFSPGLLSQTRILVLSNPPVAWLPYLSTGFLNLHTLALICTVPALEHSPFSLTNVPSLRNVSIRGINNFSITLPFNQLEFLNLRDMPLDSMIQLLLFCTNLKTFRTRASTRSRVSNTQQLLASPVILNSIEYFEWQDPYDPLSTRIRNLRLPSLRYLHFHEDFPTSGDEFLRNLPQDTLKTLHLTDFEYSNVLSEVLIWLPQIETLVLEKCNSEFVTEVISLLGSSPQSPSMFGPSSSSPDFSNSFVLLPKLKTLIITSTFFMDDPSDAFSSEFFAKLARVLADRVKRIKKAENGEAFRLEITPVQDVLWGPEAARILRDMLVRDALPLKIFAGGEEVKWN